MNAPHSLPQHLTGTTPPSPVEAGGEFSLLEYWDILVDSRWLIALITAIAGFAGLSYAFLSNPVYEANLLIQVEDTSGSAKSFLGEAASLFDVKTPATAEMEIIRSRMVVGRAVDVTRLYISAVPRRIPVIGNFLSRHAHTVSTPGIFGFGGWVSGTERLRVDSFDVPEQFEGSPFILTSGVGGNYSLSHPHMDRTLHGRVGQRLVAQLPGGTISLSVQELIGMPGAEFVLTRDSVLKTIERLQRSLRLSEKGRQSGIINAALEEIDKQRLVAILNEIGRQYVRQNIDRKAEEAQKTLAFLDVQLPQFKRQLEVAEDAYNRYRNQKGTVALDDEAKNILSQSIDLQAKLLDAQQRRRELVSRFTSAHPAVQTLDEQIAALNRAINALNAHIKTLPTLQQDTVRLERDVKVNDELYEQLRNNALQLQLIREGKTGNVRLIDAAQVPEDPIKPQRALLTLIALAAGLLASIIVALSRAAFLQGLKSPNEIEVETGMRVLSTIPLSDMQDVLAKRVADSRHGVHVLAQADPDDVAVESLRSLRTALQFMMLEAPNNRVLISGGTPGVGKSFVSANFAAVVASAGKRVLLIDADLRRGHLNQYFGLSRGPGLSDVLLGSVTLDSVIQRNVAPNLDVVSTGEFPAKPAELLEDGAFQQALNAVSPKYDMVIIDTAPVLVAADTLSVAPLAATVLLVARAGQTRVGDLHECARRLAHSGVAPTGVLFNALDLTRRHSGKYGYNNGAYNYGAYHQRYGQYRSDTAT